MWDSGIIAVLMGTECLEVGLNTLSKAVMRRGMSNFVFVFYQNSLADSLSCSFNLHLPQNNISSTQIHLPHTLQNHSPWPYRRLVADVYVY
ncbi:hypothetical protein F0562_033348 [Nyssa sinensis]|uniref:Uncharacterized protein n=1 Tax=Nyssa sinensis TaxID=561372 RepID=A0A5J5AS43_9ASTE|nr:hypothetical protein F0562_033348 [Nyssa sinensis]